MHQIIWDQDTATVRIVGPVGPGALVDAAAAVTADPRYDRLQFLVLDLVDLEEAVETLLGAADDLLANLIGAMYSNGNVRVVTVANETDVPKLVPVLMGERSRNEVRMLVVGGRKAAAEWVAKQPRLHDSPRKPKL